MAKQPFMNVVKVDNPSTNTFDLGHDVKTSFKMGWLIPSPPIEVSPKDKFYINHQSLNRFAPMVSPPMHRYDVRHETFFVPMRLLWKNFDKWITQTEIAGVLPAVPFITVHGDGFPPGTLGNYMGIPNTGDGTKTEKISALPFLANLMIYNEYYRDQNLIPEILADQFPFGDGELTAPQATEVLTLRKRAWEHDYFTSCLPFAQKGDPVMIPIGSQKVIFDNSRVSTIPGLIRNAVDPYGVVGASNLETSAAGELANPGWSPLAYDPNGTLITEDAGAATSVNDLRLAYALQRLKEKLIRGGSRLTEYYRAVFGVTPQDARLQRPEYVTGTKTPIVVSEVLNTTGTDEVPQGNMAGHGVGIAEGGGSYYAHEHGYLITITSVMPRTAYQQGINRLWFKIGDPTELIHPDMAHIGEQTVYNKEVYAFQGEDGNNDFGYMPRYSEYRTMPNFTTGEFQTAGLRSWTSTRIFASPPGLNQQFVECTPSTDIFAVTDGADHIYSHIYHDIKVNRALPKYGTPTY